MGGDNGPSITIPAALKACEHYPHLKLIFCGDPLKIAPFLNNLAPEIASRIATKNTLIAVEMEESPSSALRHKRDSSMGMAIKSVQENLADACVSAGNTGALLALSIHQLKRLEGVRRPALISSIPGANRKRVFLLDLGANVAQDANTLFQFAVMGAAMAESVEGVASPKIGLMNVGVEQNKGNNLVKDTNYLLQQQQYFDYVGYVEGDALFNAHIDVIVTDGFVGNIVLKASEGLAKFIVNEAKRVAKKNLGTRILSAFALPLLKKVYNKVNPDQYNGASLIGLRGIVVKSHGNASEEAFYYAIREAMHEVERKVPEKIEHKLHQVLGQKAD